MAGAEVAAGGVVSGWTEALSVGAAVRSRGGPPSSASVPPPPMAA
ncbi:hypothetical protein [Streptomyces sp. SAI-195]